MSIYITFQMGNMSHWECEGDWNVQDGGHGTEKLFATSHMECGKSQTVNLLDHFTEEYLDTAPELQVECSHGVVFRTYCVWMIGHANENAMFIPLLF